MARVHTHPCSICRARIECDGYPVAHDGGKHCIHDESPEPWLCEDCRDNVFADGVDDYGTAGYSADDAAEMDADAANKDEKEGA